MAKFNIFFIVFFLTAISLLAFFNRDTVDITVWKGVTYEDVPVIALIFISTVVGILSMFFVAAIRDAMHYVDNWQNQRQQKKEAKLRESYSKGLDAFFASRYEEAEELFSRIIENEPSHLNAMLRLGDIFFIKKDFVRAKELYLSAKEIAPKNIEVLRSLEKVFDAQGRWQDAIKYLDDILEIDDENIKVLKRKRDIYERYKKWEETADVQHMILKCKLPLKQEQEESRRLLGYKFELGRSYLESGAVDKAIKVLKGIIKIDKDFIAAYLALAEAYIKEGNRKEAQEYLMSGYEETSSLVFLARLEDHFIAIDEPGSIIDLYQKAIENDRQDLRIQFFLAKLYFRLEMIDHALETINSMDITQFDHPDLHTLLGSIYERRSEYEKAAAEFKKALKADKRPLVVPFCCSNCNYISKEWSDRCPDCREWNTFILDINEVCKVRKRQSSS